MNSSKPTVLEKAMFDETDPAQFDRFQPLALGKILTILSLILLGCAAALFVIQRKFRVEER